MYPRSSEGKRRTLRDIRAQVVKTGVSNFGEWTLLIPQDVVIAPYTRTLLFIPTQLLQHVKYRWVLAGWLENECITILSVESSEHGMWVEFKSGYKKVKFNTGLEFITFKFHIPYNATIQTVEANYDLDYKEPWYTKLLKWFRDEQSTISTLFFV